MRTDLRLRCTYDESDEFWPVDCDGYYVDSVVFTAHSQNLEHNRRRMIHAHGAVARPPIMSGQVDSREECTAAFRVASDHYREVTGPEGSAIRVEHMDRMLANQKHVRARERGP